MSDSPPPNPLEAYLDDNPGGMTALAEKIGCEPSTLTRAVGGQRDAISHWLADNVERATGGRVSAAAFFAICHEARRRRDGAGATDTATATVA